MSIDYVTYIGNEKFRVHVSWTSKNFLGLNSFKKTSVDVFKHNDDLRFVSNGSKVVDEFGEDRCIAIERYIIELNKKL